jgi:hypothetical protein
MEVLTLLLFVSAVWVLGALGLFAWNILHQNHEHAERLAVLPLEDNWIDPRARAGSLAVDPRSRTGSRNYSQEGKGMRP